MAADKLGCTVRFNADGDVESVEWDDGTKATGPSFNLKDRPLKDVDIEKIESIQVVNVRHRSTGQLTSCVHLASCYWWCPPGAC